MPKTPQRAAAAGFTLIELLIVVIILAILAALAIPRFFATPGDAGDNAGARHDASAGQVAMSGAKDDPHATAHAPR